MVTLFRIIECMNMGGNHRRRR